MTDALVVDDGGPPLTWIVEDDGPGIIQEIRAALARIGAIFIESLVHASRWLIGLRTRRS